MVAALHSHLSASTSPVKTCKGNTGIRGVHQLGRSWKVVGKQNDILLSSCLEAMLCDVIVPDEWVGTGYAATADLYLGYCSYHGETHSLVMVL